MWLCTLTFSLLASSFFSALLRPLRDIIYNSLPQLFRLTVEVVAFCLATSEQSGKDVNE